VLERLLADGRTLVPFRFGSLYAARTDVESFLVEREAQLVDALSRVERRVELGVRATLDAARAAELARERVDATPAEGGAGAAYLARRKTELETDTALEQEAVARVRDAHDDLAQLAVESRLNPPRGDDGRGNVELLNAAYLVDRDREAEFRDATASVAEAAPEHVRFNVTGPWPPYNFVAGELGNP
jgi:hypothetical protein